MGRVAEDLIGKIFGKLTVLERVDDHIFPSGQRGARWSCECSCGQTGPFPVLASSLKAGTTTSCGCFVRDFMREKHLKDLTGMTFGRLTVIERADDYVRTSGRRESCWSCECSCPNKTRKTIVGSSLTSGHTISCGCYGKEMARASRFTDLSGQVFGKLTVIRLDASKKRIHWLCRCFCDGKIISVDTASLNNGHTTSCGCSSESLIATQLKSYFTENYNAKTEYKLMKNPDTGWWLKCDIYVPKNIYVEIHGRQHYEFIEHFHSTLEGFEYQQYKDKLKRDWCENQGVYIEIDLRKIKTTEQALDYIGGIISLN
jgi:hypothetical protein